MSDIRLIAFRRAGYAIACLEFGKPLRIVALDEDPEIDDDDRGLPGGKPSYASASVGHPRTRERAHGEIEVRVALAGGIAQRRVDPGARDDDQDEDALERAREIVWYLVGGWDGDGEDSTVGPREESAAYLKLLTIQTERMVARRWRQIEIVAAALLSHRSLTGNQIRSLALGPARMSNYA